MNSIWFQLALRYGLQASRLEQLAFSCSEDARDAVIAGYAALASDADQVWKQFREETCAS